MRVVVTGGAGRIGQAVVKGLLEQGNDVLVIDMRVPEDRGLEFVCADVTDFAQVINNLKGADAVVHLAAYPDLGAATRTRS